jgi:hypothetical protein
MIVFKIVKCVLHAVSLNFNIKRVEFSVMNWLKRTHGIGREESSRTKESSHAHLENSSKNSATLATFLPPREANSGKCHTLGSSAWLRPLFCCFFAEEPAVCK